MTTVPTYWEIQPGFPDDNRGPLVRKSVWANLGVATVVLLTRLYVKTTRTKRLYYDDAIMVLALLFGYAHAIWVEMAVQEGFGRHFLYLSNDQRELTMKRGIFSMAWGFLSPMAGRISFAITLWFLSGTDPRVKRWPIKMFIILQLLVNVSAIILFYSQCGTELDTLWVPTKYVMFFQQCSNPKIQTYYGYFQGSINTLTDAYLALLPAILIEHSRLSRKAKITLALCLCLSVLAMTASIVKTYEARVLSSVTDFTYDLCIYVIWMSIELNIVIIISSVPLIRPLFKRRRPKSQHSGMVRRESVSLASMFMKAHDRVAVRSFDRVGSEEDLSSPQSMRSAGSVGSAAIRVVTEVSVTYQSNDVPFVHAALVGLIQGEIDHGHRMGPC